MTVELIYESGCPNVADTRANLLRAFSETQLPAKWTEWDAASPDSPDHVRGFGSPTILVDGNDLTGQARTGTSCCRLYGSSDGRQTGAPPMGLIRQALLQSGDASRTGWRRNLAVLPGMGVALLPKLTCPMCWPAYAGILSTLGLSFLISADYLLAITVLFLASSVGSLALGARGRHGLRPALAGAAASVLMLFGKFRLESKAAVYAGLALLAIASIWNGWPRNVAGPCPQCVPAGGDLARLSAKEKEQ